MEQHPSFLALGAQLIGAGLGAELALQHLLAWRRDRANQVAGWLGISCASLAALLLANVWASRAPPSQLDIAIFLRAGLVEVALLLLVPTIGAFAAQRWSRWL